MRLILAILVVLVSVTVQAQTPEWLADLRLVAPSLRTRDRVPTSLETAEIRRIARSFKTPKDLAAALNRLPTAERRERAYKTLISYTIWAQQPGFTQFGTHGPHAERQK